MTTAAMHQAVRQELRRSERFRLKIDEAALAALEPLGHAAVGVAAVRGLSNWSLRGPHPTAGRSFPRMSRLSRVQRACLVASAVTGCTIAAWDINQIGSSVRLTISGPELGAAVALEEFVYVTESGEALWDHQHGLSRGIGRVTRFTSNVAVVVRGTEDAPTAVGCEVAVSLIRTWCGGHASQRIVSPASLKAGAVAI